MELPGSLAGTSSCRDWLASGTECYSNPPSLEGGLGNVILLKGKIIIWLLVFMDPGHKGNSWNLPGSCNAVCLVLNR